jgi:hypothetical protein
MAPGTNGEAFPFFTWMHYAFTFLFQMLEGAFTILFLFLGRIAELLVLPFTVAVDRSISAVNWLIEIGWPVIMGTAASGITGHITALLDWAWGQFTDFFGTILLWLDGALPATLTLDISGLVITVSYIKAATSWFNVGLFVTTVTLGYSTIWTIALAKIIWRSIPTIG